MKAFFQNIKTCLWDKYYSVQGRAARSEFWLFYLLAALIGIACMAISLIIETFFGETGFFLFFLSCLPISLFLLIPFVSVSVRRLHDLNLSGWWLLLFLFGSIYLIVFLFRGTNGPNRFDLDPSKPVRRSPVYFGVWIGLWILFAVWIAYTQIQWSPTAITEKSHLIVEPRAENGQIDYYAGLMAPFQDVYQDSDKNGYRLILEAVGPRCLGANPAAASKTFRSKQREKPDFQSPLWRETCAAMNVNPDMRGPFTDFVPFDADYLRDRLEEQEQKQKQERLLAVENENSDNETDIKTDIKYDNKSDEAGEAEYYDPFSLNLSGLKIDWKEYCRKKKLTLEDLSSDGLYSRSEADDILDFYSESLQSQPWRTEDHPQAAQWFEQYDPLLNLLSEAVRKPYYLYYVPRPKMSILFGNTDPVQFQNVLGLALRMRTEREIGDGQFDEAISDLEAAYRLAIHLEQGPIFIGSLIGTALENRTAETLRQLIGTGRLKESQLLRLEEMFQTLPDRPHCERVVRSDILGAYDELQSFLINSQESDSEDNRYGDRPFFANWQSVRFLIDENQYRNEFSELMIPYQRAIAEPNVLKRIAAWESAVEEYRQKTVLLNEWPRSITDWLTAAGRGRKLGHYMFWQIGRILPNTNLSLIRRDMYIQMARISVAAERYRLSEGAYPKSLELLVEKNLLTDASILIDPFSDGKPFEWSINPQTEQDWLAEQDLQTEQDVGRSEVKTDWKSIYRNGEKPYYRPYFLHSIGLAASDDRFYFHARLADDDWTW